MLSETSVFRVYRCPRCHNIGYVPIENVEVDSACTLCRTKISDGPSMMYAATVEEAESMIRGLALDSGQRTLPTGDARRLGVRKRVFNIVEALVDTNRGRPVSIARVLQECSDAGIDQDKASAFIDAMLSDGCLTNCDSGVTIPGRRGFDVRY